MEPSQSKPSLREAFSQVTRPQIGVRCSTCLILESMSPEDAATFVEIMASRDNSVALIVTALKAAGYPASRGSLARHRRGECKPVH